MKQTVREDDGLGVRIACSASLRERLKKSSAKAQTEGRTKLTRLAKSATLVSDRSAKTCLFTSVSPSSGCRRNSVEDMLSWESFDEKQHSYLASLVEPNAEPEADLPILLVDLHNLGQGTQDNRGSDHENLSSERLNKAKHDLLVILASEKSEEVLETLFASGSCFHSTRNEEERHKRLLQLKGVRKVATIDYPALTTFKGDRACTQAKWEYYSSLQSEFRSVTELVKLVMACCRTLQWKFSIVEEIHRLARCEQLSKLERDEIQQRKVELEELENEIGQLEPEQADMTTVNNILRSLREARDEYAAVLSDKKLYKELEAETLSVVDQILAMTLQRSNLSRIGSETLTTHHQLRESWRTDFGRLPFLQADLQAKSSDSAHGHLQDVTTVFDNSEVIEEAPSEGFTETFGDWIENLFLQLEDSTAMRAVALVEEYERCIRGDDILRSKEITKELVGMNLTLMHTPAVHCVVTRSAAARSSSC